MKNQLFMIVGYDSVLVTIFFTSQPCDNVLRQTHDSITLVSLPNFLFCAADSRTMQDKITECPAEEAAPAAAACCRPGYDRLGEGNSNKVGGGDEEYPPLLSL